MIRCSDRPKTYWGYYQDYLVYISEKKILKKNLDFFQNLKLGKTGVAGESMLTEKWG